MPYLPDPSLRQRLTAERRLAKEQVLGIAAPVADALGYAHRTGILHRDIKPENILFAEGHPIVADFGIAKALSTASGGNLTRTGFSLRTPGYMSPQQAAGVTDLDARADVYGLAAMIYEMLIGEVLPPGQWPGEDAVRAGRFRDVPAQHRTRLDELGSDVEAALLRGLSLRREQRTATPRSLSMSSPAAPLPRGGAIRKQRFRRLCAARRSDLTLPVVADRWRAGDRIEILYLPDRGLRQRDRHRPLAGFRGAHGAIRGAPPPRTARRARSDPTVTGSHRTPRRRRASRRA